MQLSETTNQSGLVQRVERNTRRPYGSSGDELKEIINDINEAEDTILTSILAKNDKIRFDDPRHTKAPKGKFNIVANQNDYVFDEDEQLNKIYNIVGVRILHNSGDTQYHDLNRITADDPSVPEILTPNTAITGTPNGFVELGGRIYFDVLPNASITDGGYIIFQRAQSRFTVTGTSGDDTTECMLPEAWHPLVALLASFKWNSINRTDDTNLLTVQRDEIRELTRSLGVFIELQHPTRNRMSFKKKLYI